jgi:hypothetical protein
VPVEGRARGAGPAPARGAARGPGAPPAARGGRSQEQTQNLSGIPGAPPGTAASGLAKVSGVAYSLSSDGLLHVMGLQSGKDIQRPAPFLPANARWSDPIAVGTTLYAATSGNCGGAPSGIWAIDLESEAKPVASWRSNGGGIVGDIAFATDGTLIAAIGPGQTTGDGKANSIVALDSKTLQVKDWFTQPTAEFVTGPTIFRHNDKDIVAAATKDGRILLLDAASPGGANHTTPLHASSSVLGTGATLAAPALATWQDATGTQWILAPVAGRLPAGVQATNGAISSGAVLALKLVDAGGALSLAPGWVSHNLAAPATPIIVNGVVFALSTGRPAAASGRGTAAVLHAYDGTTGKALWTSEKTMTTFASPGSFWSALGQTYVGTHDGTLYAFGFLDERR